MSKPSGGQQLDPGSKVSRYEILEVLGAGGFGITYKVFDTSLHCEAAMKEYLPAEFAVRAGQGNAVVPRSEQVAGEFQHGLKRFLDEARTLAKFKNRHIVRVSDYLEDNGTAYLVMDYEEGQPLRGLLKQRGGSLSETEIKKIFIPILEGLKVVHGAGLLHRDIKPDNIYLRRDGPPVLLDFGAARQYTASRTQSVTATVTPGYAPFEQYQPDGNLGAWTDIYGLGATLYACISGQPPLDAITRHAQPRADPLPLAQDIGSDRYSEALLRTVDWMLRPSISDRPQSVEEVLPCIQGRTEPPEGAVPTGGNDAATIKLSGDETGETAPTMARAGPHESTTAPAAGSRTGLVVGAAAAVAIAVGVGWWLAQDGQFGKTATATQESTSVVETAAPETTPDESTGSETVSADTTVNTPAVTEAADSGTGATEPAGDGMTGTQVLATDTGDSQTADTGTADTGTAETDTSDSGAADSEPATVAPAATDPDTATGGVTDQMTENVDEFLTALMLESDEAGGGAPADAVAGQPSSGQVADLLGRAEAYREASRLVSPAGDNALDLYREALAIDADNTLAREGLRRIGDVFEQAAVTMLSENQADVGRRIVERGLQAVPDHQGLQQLRSRLASQ